MANSFAVSRSHLIYGLCLPVAVLVGYLLATPLEPSSKVVVMLVITVLSIPLLMRWHHPLLLLSWNAAISPAFISGRPFLWMMMAMISLFFCVLNRSLGHKVNFFQAPSVSKSLLALGLVVGITAYLTGGVGIRALGSETFGGKKYVYLMTAIAGYFALASQKIPRNRAGLWVFIFFVTGISYVVGYMATVGGGPLHFLLNFFPLELADENPVLDMRLLIPQYINRVGEVSIAATAMFCCLLAHYGVKDILNLKKPWRLILLLATVVASMFAGFRSVLVLLGLTFLVVFYLEGLVKTRYFTLLLVGGVLGISVLLPFVDRLPLSVQRTLSFLPVGVDPMVRRDAEGSTTWRVDMWKEVVPLIPKYLIKGKGYGLSPDELFMTSVSAMRGYVAPAETALIAGDYHSGPLSVIIPFGIFGAMAFLWFLWASVKVLYQNYRHGDPSLKKVNTFLFGFFIVRIFQFFFVFGSIHSDLYVFTGLIGLSVSLNNGVAQLREKQEEEELAAA